MNFDLWVTSICWLASWVFCREWQQKQSFIHMYQNSPRRNLKMIAIQWLENVSFLLQCRTDLTVVSWERCPVGTSRCRETRLRLLEWTNSVLILSSYQSINLILKRKRMLKFDVFQSHLVLSFRKVCVRPGRFFCHSALRFAATYLLSVLMRNLLFCNMQLGFHVLQLTTKTSKCDPTKSVPSNLYFEAWIFCTLLNHSIFMLLDFPTALVWV